MNRYHHLVLSIEAICIISIRKSAGYKVIVNNIRFFIHVIVLMNQYNALFSASMLVKCYETDNLSSMMIFQKFHRLNLLFSLVNNLLGQTPIAIDYS